MSVQATSWVWEQHRWTGNSLLIMLAIADAANREGRGSCQGVKTIARMVGCSRSTAFAILADLEREGAIIRAGKHPKYGTVMWEVPIGLTEPVEDEGGSDSRTPEGVQILDGGPAGRTGGVQPTGPNPKEITPEKHPVVPSPAVEPLQHASRGMFHEWQPRREFIADLHQRFPDVSLHQERNTFVDWYLQASKTSRSWEAMFAVWCQNKQEKVDAEKKEGTDELGVPRRQRRNGTRAAQPGDPDYVDHDEIAEAARQAALQGRSKS